jgi:hypothetical protein
MRPNSHKESGAKIIKDHHVDAKTTETDSPWQNRAEAGIENKKGDKATHESKQKKPLWDYCSTYTCKLRSMLALPRNPEGRPGAEVMTGRRKISPSTCTLIGTKQYTTTTSSIPCRARRN